MKAAIIVVIFLYASMMLFFYACTKDHAQPINKPPCDTVNVTFIADIQPIMQSNCALSGCHDNGTQANGIALETYEQVKAEATLSRFLCAIKHAGNCVPMPPGGQRLNSETITKIECWITKNFPQ